MSTLPPLVRNWLIGRYLEDPTPGLCSLSDKDQPEPVVFVRYSDFADFLAQAGIELLPSLDVWLKAGYIEDVRVDIELSTDGGNKPLPYSLARLNLSPGRHRLIGIRRGVLDAPVDDPRIRHAAEHVPASGRLCPRKRRTTWCGGAQEKLIAALTKHHRYADGGCLNLEPIGNNELARLAGVGAATALRFFNKWFKGYAKYRSICMRDVSKLIDTIKAMRGEFVPSNEPNYGDAPPAERERDG
jgi:hypothetical protein